MKNLLICAFLSLLFLGCELRLEPADPVYYEETYDYCMYDPLPLDSSDMLYCDSYSNAECCYWVQHHSDDWICEYDWCFYWDTCEWEYIQSECWW